jgi:hypothetical protein
MKDDQGFFLEHDTWPFTSPFQEGSLNPVIPEMFNWESFDSGHAQSVIYLCVT